MRSLTSRLDALEAKSDQSIDIAEVLITARRRLQRGEALPQRCIEEEHLKDLNQREIVRRLIEARRRIR